MDDVSPIGRLGPTAFGRSSQPSRQVSPAASQQERGRDQVQLSHTAQLLSKIHDLPEVRQDLVDRVRSEIENGTYETPEKLDAALQGLIEDHLA